MTSVTIPNVIKSAERIRRRRVVGMEMGHEDGLDPIAGDLVTDGLHVARDDSARVDEDGFAHRRDDIAVRAQSGEDPGVRGKDLMDLQRRAPLLGSRTLAPSSPKTMRGSIRSTDPTVAA